MSEFEFTFRSVILAGDRPGGNELSRAFNIPASVLVPVAGKPALQYVINAINDSRYCHGGIICGPAREVVEGSKIMLSLLQTPDFDWLAPATGPSGSGLSALHELDHYPALLTAGDHALLTSEIVDDFCTGARHTANDSNFDLVIGFVPHTLVRAAWPDSKRTIMKFSNGHFCGSNLFAVINPKGLKSLEFWQQVESERKQPWRIARRFGVLALIRYLLRRLTLEDALRALSGAAGCRIGFVLLDQARAAVDVDSVADQKLAEEILSRI